MVRGMEQFRKHFEGFEDCDVLIGGAACDLAMEPNPPGSLNSFGPGQMSAADVFEKLRSIYGVHR